MKRIKKDLPNNMGIYVKGKMIFAGYPLNVGFLVDKIPNMNTAIQMDVAERQLPDLWSYYESAR